MFPRARRSPVLSGILIEAAGDKIILQATDLELSIQYSAAALVEEDGKAVLPESSSPTL